MVSLVGVPLSLKMKTRSREMLRAATKAQPMVLTFIREVVDEDTNIAVIDDAGVGEALRYGDGGPGRCIPDILIVANEESVKEGRR